MSGDTRLSSFLKKSVTRIEEKFFFFQNRFSSSLFFLFFGFLLGNLFGTFLNALRSFIYWDGFIVGSVIIFIEIISYISYHKPGRSFFNFWTFRVTNTLVFKRLVFWKYMNFLKIGLLVGFFIDAFKVGS